MRQILTPSVEPMKAEEYPDIVKEPKRNNLLQQFNKLTDYLNFTILRIMQENARLLNTQFRDTYSGSFTIGDNDGTHYHHFTFRDGLLESYTEDTSA